MIEPKCQCNLGYVGHSTSIVKDKDGTSVLLSLAPFISLTSIDQYEELLDQMLDSMTEFKEDWVHWQDNWIVGLEEESEV